MTVDDEELLVGRRLKAQRISDPKRWSQRVRDVVSRHGARLRPAAAELEIGHRTLQRWAHELNIPSAPTGRHVTKEEQVHD